MVVSPGQQSDGEGQSPSTVVHVQCEGQQHSFPVDAVIFATGYRYQSCAPPWLVALLKPPRYLHVWPTNANHPPDVAVVGFVRPYLTSIPMLIEFQARWVAAVFAGRAPATIPPTTAERRQCARRAAEKQRREFPCDAERMPFLVDPYDYCNTVAKHIGPTASIPYDRIIRESDWELLWSLLMDSWNPSAFRLNDACEWKRNLARKTILEYHRHHPTCMRIIEYFACQCSMLCIRQYTIYLFIRILFSSSFCLKTKERRCVFLILAVIVIVVLRLVLIRNNKKKISRIHLTDHKSGIGGVCSTTIATIIQETGTN